MRRAIWFTAASLAVVLLLAILFLYGFERVVEDEWRGPRAEAFANRWLAAERLLQRLGVPSRRVTTVEAEASDGVVLVMAARRGAMSAATLEQLEQLVREGGHLIVESEPFAARDPVFDHFAIGRLEVEYEYLDDEHEDDGIRQRLPFEFRDLLAANPPGSALIPIALPGSEPLVALMSGGEDLYATEATYSVEHEGTTALLQLELGRGRVTALNDIQFLGNWQIGRNDHAELFWRLIAPGGKAPLRVLFYRGERIGLGAWLRQHALPALGGLALLVALALWHAIPRFGPIAPDPERARRRLLDHLRASGRLLWSAGQRDTLIEAAKTSALARVRAHHPHFALLDVGERAALLSLRYGIPAELAQALSAERADLRIDPRTLIDACRRIHAHGNPPEPNPFLEARSS